MTVSYYPETSVKDIEQAMQTALNNPQVHAVFILVADNKNVDITDLNPFLKQVQKPIFGGIFPGLIFEQNKKNTGFIIACIYAKITPLIVQNISQMGIQRNVDELLTRHVSNFAPCKTVFVLVDGLAKRINAFMEGLYFTLGSSYSYIGGGAGSLSLTQQPCLICNQGVLQDAAILFGIEDEAGVGVQHGWEEIAGPFHVTNVELTKIYELDFKPALQVYAEVVEAHSGKSISASNFFDIAKAYPFGITRDDDKNIVRDPLKIGDKNSLICVGEIDKGEYVSILHGNERTLLLAAKEAAKEAKSRLLNNTAKNKVSTVFFVDCISRVLFLEDRFAEELAVVYNETKPEVMFGILSLGEIANIQGDSLDFYNKTAVIGCL